MSLSLCCLLGIKYVTTTIKRIPYFPIKTIIKWKIEQFCFFLLRSSWREPFSNSFNEMTRQISCEFADIIWLGRFRLCVGFVFLSYFLLWILLKILMLMLLLLNFLLYNKFWQDLLEIYIVSFIYFSACELMLLWVTIQIYFGVCVENIDTAGWHMGNLLDKHLVVEFTKNVKLFKNS